MHVELSACLSMALTCCTYCANTIEFILLLARELAWKASSIFNQIQRPMILAIHTQIPHKHTYVTLPTSPLH